jgi:NADPH:quinone reductase-like Zn-dependent oxidoreductase
VKAVVRTRYGPPEVLRLADVPTPVPKNGEVLVEVHAVSLNASDWESLVGKPAYARMGGRCGRQTASWGQTSPGGWWRRAAA